MYILHDTRHRHHHHVASFLPWGQVDENVPQPCLKFAIPSILTGERRFPFLEMHMAMIQSSAAACSISVQKDFKTEPIYSKQMLMGSAKSLLTNNCHRRSSHLNITASRFMHF